MEGAAQDSRVFGTSVMRAIMGLGGPVGSKATEVHYPSVMLRECDWSWHANARPVELLITGGLTALGKSLNMFFVPSDQEPDEKIHLKFERKSKREKKKTEERRNVLTVTFYIFYKCVFRVDLFNGLGSLLSDKPQRWRRRRWWRCCC